jgi:hypothetical protein
MTLEEVANLLMTKTYHGQDVTGKCGLCEAINAFKADSDFKLREKLEKLVSHIREVGVSYFWMEEISRLEKKHGMPIAMFTQDMAILSALDELLGEEK